MILRCPNCGNSMKYFPAKKLSRASRKACVYCGKSFQVLTHIQS